MDGCGAALHQTLPPSETLDVLTDSHVMERTDMWLVSKDTWEQPSCLYWGYYCCKRSKWVYWLKVNHKIGENVPCFSSSIPEISNFYAANYVLRSLVSRVGAADFKLYWHCNKLKPEPRHSWSIMAKGRRFLYLFSESFAPTLLMCHLRWNHLLNLTKFFWIFHQKKGTVSYSNLWYLKKNTQQTKSRKLSSCLLQIGEKKKKVLPCSSFIFFKLDSLIRLTCIQFYEWVLNCSKLLVDLFFFFLSYQCLVPVSDLLS